MARSAFWIDNPISIGMTSGGQNFTSLMTGTPPIDARRATVVRMIIELGIHSESVAGAWGVNLVDLAIGVASQEAFGTAGALSDPNTDERPTRGWMWKTRVVAWQNGAGSAIVQYVSKDIHSGRKLYDGEPFLIGVNTASAGTTASYRCSGIVRLLLLLP